MSRNLKLAIAAALPATLLSIVAMAQTAASNTAAPATAAHVHASMYQHLLKKLDTDGDGKISLAEFQAGAAARFSAADAQHTGSLTAAQLAASPQAEKHNLRAATMLVHHMDTAHKGYLTQDDFVNAAQQRFAKLDTQGAGKLSADQLVAAGGFHGGHALAASPTPTVNADGTTATPTGGKRAAFQQKYAQAELAKLDTNHDGVVSQDEYVAAAKAKFAALDTQGTGQVTAQQIATSQVAQQRDLKFAEHEVKKLDANSDGVISQSEYLAASQSRFAKLDKNGDGFITEDEMPAHHWAQQKSKLSASE
jgi:Ca2+-binding EF-hand superfamily protein